MNDWLTRVSAASGIPSEIFILGFMAFFLLIFLAIGIIYCLIRLRSISANTLQTIAQARMAWREDLGAAVTQSKDLIADRMKPSFIETERTLERSFQEVSAGIRSETFASLKAVQDTLNQSLTRNDEQISSVNKRFEELSKNIREEIAESGKVVQSTLNQSLIRNDEQIKSLNGRFEELSKTLRGEIFANLKAVQDTLNQSLTRNDEQIRGVNQRFETLSSTLNTSLNELRKQIDDDLKALNKDNEAKLEKIRETVEEKLQNTLTSKVGESFSQVTQQLNRVYEGLGQMKELAEEVGGLKRVFVNVKSRGMLGEVQLEALLKEYFTESQYVKNVHPVPSKPKMVKQRNLALTGNVTQARLVELLEANYPYTSCMVDTEMETVLSMFSQDAKFPVEDYQRLLQAADEGDREGVAEARSKLRTRFRNEGKSIAEYINVPETTDFAIMFIPSEGLYAEALALEGLTNELFTSYRVYIMGPSTLASALCAYRAGFQTLAIEKKSSEIRKILSSVQTEFAKYGEVLNKLKSQVETVAKTVDIVQTKTRKMNLQLEVASESDKEEDQPMSLPSPVSNQSSLTSEQ